MEKFTKPALAFQQQVGLLRSRGLRIDDERRAIRHLSNISYYRLSAYMLPFKERGADGKVTDVFKQGTTWDDVYNLYRFDRKLRLLVFDAIERIEIALRTQIIYQLSHKYGSHWQNKPELFNDKVGLDKKTAYQDIQRHLDELLKTNHKVEYIEHYLAKYDDPPTPPCWMSVELLYFNELSKICKNLKHRQDLVGMAKAFGIPSEKVFCSWLHTINYVRNICAHHARLWNIKLAVPPPKFEYSRSDRVWLTNEEVKTVQRSKLYYFLCVILFLLQTVNPNSHFKKYFRDLLHKFPDVDVRYMGFPEDWREHPLWRFETV